MSQHPILNERLEAELQRVAREDGRDPADLLNQAVLEFLEDSREGEAVLARVRSGEEITFSPEAVKRRLGLDE
jgi:predicted DNA-binding protein